jgi:hypothetical protein
MQVFLALAGLAAAPGLHLYSIPVPGRLHARPPSPPTPHLPSLLQATSHGLPAWSGLTWHRGTARGTSQRTPGPPLRRRCGRHWGRSCRRPCCRSWVRCSCKQQTLRRGASRRIAGASRAAWPATASRWRGCRWVGRAGNTGPIIEGALLRHAALLACCGAGLGGLSVEGLQVGEPRWARWARALLLRYAAGMLWCCL